MNARISARVATASPLEFFLIALIGAILVTLYASLMAWFMMLALGSLGFGFWSYNLCLTVCCGVVCVGNLFRIGASLR